MRSDSSEQSTLLWFADCRNSTTFRLAPLGLIIEWGEGLFWTWYGRFTDPPPPVGKGGSSSRRVHIPLCSDPPSNLPQSLGRLETVPDPVCRPPVASLNLWHEDPPPPVGKGGSSSRRVHVPLCSDPPFNLPQSLGRLQTVPDPVCRPPVASLNLWHEPTPRGHTLTTFIMY